MGLRGPKPLPLDELVLRRTRQDPGGCWTWMGYTDQNGYGRVRMRDRLPSQLVHRIAWIALIGPIPDGLTLDHLCLNKACVNPDHLEPVTHRENSLRAKSNGDTCLRGHQWSEYAYIRPGNGQRMCAACARDREKTRIRAPRSRAGARR